MDMKENIRKAVESKGPDRGEINAILLKLLNYFRKLYGNDNRDTKSKP